MLPKNIFNSNKIISFLLIILLLITLFHLFIPNEVKAVSQAEKFKNYPGYQALIEKLERAYPNWKFEILETGLDWSEVIIAESTGRHGINVVPNSWGSSWKCSCGKAVDVSWRCASTATVAYYMDPRNSLNEDYIFQFEQLTYDTKQTADGVQKILADCEYMQGKITYYDTAGKKQTIDKTYVQAIMEASKKYNVSPYHLASRIRQEQGPGKAGSMISGTWTGVSGYKGYYNYFNIGAYGPTTTEIIKSGLTYAKNKGWTDPEKAIHGGAAFLSNDYISYGQDTLYLQKFNVADKNKNYYSHQYMTNVSASKTEGEEVREAYRKLGMLTKASNMTFKIPVYKNMPIDQSPMPGTEKVVTQDIQVNENSVQVREGKGTNYKSIASLNKGTKILRIELDNKKDANGRYWDKVVLSNGAKGYISREYLTEISVQSNCNEEYSVTEYTNFRNGPGTVGTTVLKVLSPGQIVTVVEKGKYNKLNGENWYRVKLSEGLYGYMAADYLKAYDPTTSEIEKVKVVCTDGLNVRKEPKTGSGSTILKTLTKGVTLTRTQKNVKTSDNTYIWDKVTTEDGIVGYVVRQDPKTKEPWIEPVSSDNGTTQKPAIQGDGFKSKDANLVCEPNMTVEKVKKVATDAIFKNGSTTIATGKVGTGWTVTTGGKTYTIVVKGDLTGNGQVTTIDAARALKNAAGKYPLTGAFLQACDVTGDGKVTTVDAARILKAAAGKYDLTI